MKEVVARIVRQVEPRSMLEVLNVLHEAVSIKIRYLFKEDTLSINWCRGRIQGFPVISFRTSPPTPCASTTSPAPRQTQTAQRRPSLASISFDRLPVRF